jgi:replicative DNA helicase
MTDNINKCLLAAILNEPELFEKTNKNGNIFSDAECKSIYDVMLKIKTNNKQIIIDYYKKNDPEKIDMFLECYNYYFDRDQFKNYYDDVLCSSMKLKLYEKAKELMKDKTKSTIEVKQEFQNIITEVSIDEEQDIVPCQKVLTSMVKNFNSPVNANFTPSGIDVIDNYGGYRNSTGFVIIAARPSIGKTSLALNLIYKNMVDNLRIGLFSMEEDAESVMSGLSCSISGVEEKIYNMRMLNNVQTDLLTRAFDTLYYKNFWIDTTAGLDIEQIKRKARIMKYKLGVQIIYLDYLQLLQVHDKQYRGRTEQVCYISQQVKILQRELNIPIVCMAQINRETEKENRAPKMSDLKDSGSLEQDADLIWLLYSEDPPENDVIKLGNIIAKFRKGGRSRFFTVFDKKIRRISKGL